MDRSEFIAATIQLREALIPFLRQISPQASGAKNLMAARAVVSRFVSTQTADYFMKLVVNEQDRWRQRSAELINIATVLFYFSDSPGFGDLLAKLKRFDLQEMHNELHVAYYFATKGYDVTFRPESKVQGVKSYDFEVTYNEEKHNIEVCTLNFRPFSAEKISSRIRKKKRQLPKNESSILVFVHRADFLRNEDIGPLVGAVRASIADTSRIQGVMMMMQSFVQRDEVREDRIPEIVYQSFIISSASEPKRFDTIRALEGPEAILRDDGLFSIDLGNFKPKIWRFSKWARSVISASEQQHRIAGRVKQSVSEDYYLYQPPRLFP